MKIRQKYKFIIKDCVTHDMCQWRCTYSVRNCNFFPVYKTNGFRQFIRQLDKHTILYRLLCILIGEQKKQVSQFTYSQAIKRRWEYYYYQLIFITVIPTTPACNNMRSYQMCWSLLFIFVLFFFLCANHCFGKSAQSEKFTAN